MLLRGLGYEPFTPMLFPVVHSVSWSGRHNVFANSVMHLMQDKAAAMTTCFADGSPGRIRTSDQPLRRRLLFPLSYRQIKSPAQWRGLAFIHVTHNNGNIYDLFCSFVH